jgi:hypothetical protein
MEKGFKNIFLESKFYYVSRSNSGTKLVLKDIYLYCATDHKVSTISGICWLS